MAKNYRVINGFYYRGKDGKNKDSVLISPGENIPEMGPSEIEKLLHEEKICEVDENNQNIKYEKLRNLTDDQISGLVSKGPQRIMQELRSGIMYASDTLTKLYREAERLKMPQTILEAIEDKFTNK